MYSYYGYALWVALTLFIISFLYSGRDTRGQAIIAGFGWIVFSIHWFMQPSKYIEGLDPFNAFLTFAMAIFCLCLAFSFMTVHKESLFLLTRVTTIACIFYFPFAEIPALHDALISLNTHTITDVAKTVFGVRMILDDPYIYFNDHHVRLILGCTAIESMALFIGVIFGIRAPPERKVAAFLVSIPVIFALNIIRNIFVIVAYGNGWFDGWFGLGSFYVAHNILAKIGSTIALIIIAYFVLKILPELLNLIENAWSDLRSIVL
ncbi:MAG: archaeosortase A [Candidatus Syntropharchaeales archaeon]